MYLLRKPNSDQIGKFIELQSQLDFTYAAVGATRDGEHPPGFLRDHNSVQLGVGQAAYAAARQALRAWLHYRFDWIELHRPELEPAAHQTVGVLARGMGLWVLNACRVVYVLEEDRPIRRFAFAYGTLPDHPESGEERFQVECREDDSVWYDILAFSRPRDWIARIAYPYVRWKQKQFARDSKLAMRSAVNDALNRTAT